MIIPDYSNSCNPAVHQDLSDSDDCIAQLIKKTPVGLIGGLQVDVVDADDGEIIFVDEAINEEAGEEQDDCGQFEGVIILFSFILRLTDRCFRIDVYYLGHQKNNIEL
jgi:hypothetical protein